MSGSFLFVAGLWGCGEIACAEAVLRCAGLAWPGLGWAVLSPNHVQVRQPPNRHRRFQVTYSTLRPLDTARSFQPLLAE